MYKFLDSKSFSSFSLVFGSPEVFVVETTGKRTEGNNIVTIKTLKTHMKGTNILHGPFLSVAMTKRSGTGEKCWREDIFCNYFDGQIHGTLSRKSWFFVSNKIPVLWGENFSEHRKGMGTSESCVRSVGDKEKMESFEQLKTKIFENVLIQEKETVC
ncbi:hypothetical protein PMV_170 [Port-miou virus]|uniref:Uncharacterized protein n=1 Tax=Port-miou virus TaxID=1733873 RepID=A0A0N9P8Q8_9VIRU|nr:hypothetical protein PMV_170 [Port-miou virus]